LTFSGEKLATGSVREDNWMCYSEKDRHRRLC